MLVKLVGQRMLVIESFIIAHYVPFPISPPLVAQSLNTLSVLLALSAGLSYAQDAAQAPAVPANEQISLDRQLMNAVHDKNAEQVRQLLAAGANANMRDKHGEHPLHWAAGAKSTNILKMLLANKKIDVNAVDYFGFTPLSVAATDEIEQLLRDAGATPPQE